MTGRWNPAPKTMPVNFKNPDNRPMSGKTADKDYFLDKDGNLASDEASAATLLVRAGQEMTAEQAEKVGAGPQGKVAREGEDAEDATADAAEADDAVAESAKAAKPSSNKKASPSSNKGVKK